MAKEHLRALRQEFAANETRRELLAEEYSSLKIRVAKVEGTMKESLESVDKFQADLDTALASNLGLESQTKSAEIKWPCCSSKVLELQAQVEEA